MGHTMETLDLGGGFPAAGLSENQIEILKSTCNDPLGFKVMAEPGRYFSSNSCHLATRVIGKRVKGGRTCYHVNESLYHSMNCVLMDGFTMENDNSQFYSKLDVKGQDSGSSMLEKPHGSLFGMTCDGMDIIANNMSIPDLQVGDWLVMGGMGSYTYGPRSTFNGMKSLTKIVLWGSDRVKEEAPSQVKDQEKKKKSSINNIIQV